MSNTADLILIETTNTQYADVSAFVRVGGIIRQRFVIQPFRLASTVKPAEEGTQAYQVVLNPGLRQGEYVTHIQASQTGKFHGHYFSSLGEAINDYCARCRQERVHPDLSEEAARIHLAWVHVNADLASARQNRRSSFDYVPTSRP